MSQEKIMKEIQNFTQIPEFVSEQQEAEFWDNHCLGDELLTKMETVENQVPIEQAILEKLRLLPADKQQEILDKT